MNIKLFSFVDQTQEKTYAHMLNNIELPKAYGLKGDLELLDHIDSKTKESLLIDQYKLVANSYDAIQQRRISNNSVFILIYSVIIGLYSLLSSENIPLADARISYSIYVIFILGIIVGLTWIDVNISIINTEKHKYMLLHTFETHMPLKIFTKPLDASKSGKSTGGNRKTLATRYFDLVLPVFMISSLALNLFFMMFK